MSQMLKVQITFYGYPDNDDGHGHFGTNIIAHHQDGRPTNQDGDPIASGIGTYANPLTAATAEGNHLLPPGTLVYVPGFKKYLLVEDDCASCDSDDWIDIWMESNANFADEVQACEEAWTPDDSIEVEVQPPNNHAVDTTPFFNMNTGVCRSSASSKG